MASRRLGLGVADASGIVAVKASATSMFRFLLSGGQLLKSLPGRLRESEVLSCSTSPRFGPDYHREDRRKFTRRSLITTVIGQTITCPGRQMTNVLTQVGEEGNKSPHDNNDNTKATTHDAPHPCRSRNNKDQ